MKKSLKPRDAFAGQAAVLKAGAAQVDITPPHYVGLLMSSVEGRWAPFQSVRTPLKARVITLACGETQVAIISLDLLGLTSAAVGGWARFKQGIARRTEPRFHPDRIVITCTHTHNAPESSGVTDLYRTEPFRLWITKLQQKLAEAINHAAAAAQPANVAIAETELRQFSLQRRIPTPNGIVMSDSVQPIKPELFQRGPIDHRVRGIWFQTRSGLNLATVVHALCHPVHEMCQPHMSADFPGELCDALETVGAFGLPLFLNGAAGDVNPPTVSEGAEAARRHGQALAKVIRSAVGEAKQIDVPSLFFCSRTIQLPMRSLKGNPIAQTCSARLNALSLGSTAILFVPGEVFVETALDIEKASPFENTIIVGFSESSVGYVPPARAFEEGGYEIGPGKWSFLQASAEAMIRQSGTGLLRQLMSRQAGKTTVTKAKPPIFEPNYDLQVTR